MTWLKTWEGRLNWDEKLNAVIIPPVTVQIPPGTAGTVSIAAGDTIIEGRLVGNKAYAPVRQLAEALGRKVIWNESSKTVTIQ